MAPRPRDPLTGRFYENAIHTTAVSLFGTLKDALAEAGSKASQGLRQSVEELAKPPSRGVQREMYDRLGHLTYEAVMAAYDERVERNGHAVYRAGSDPQRDRLTRKLRPVLAGNEGGTIYRVVNGPGSGSGVRIELFNPKVLNQRARHWARLNFGAGPEGEGGGGNRTYRVDLETSPGRTARSFDLSFRAGARPAYRIPKGFWMEGGEFVAPQGPPKVGSAFYPASQVHAGVTPQTPKISEGFAGRFFLDEGLRAFALAFPVEFDRLLEDTLGKRSRLRLTFNVEASSRI